MNDWWLSLYDDLVAELLLAHRDPDLADRAVEFITKAAGLRPGDAVFDQGCGTGRLALPMLRRGLRVHGVDAIASYVEAARAACLPFGDAASFACGDMADRGPPFTVDAVVSWWTCLGYRADDEANTYPLVRAFEALRPGGAFVVDTMNVAQVLRDFRPTQIDTLQRPDGVATLVRESRVDLASGTLFKTWSWRLPDGTTFSNDSAVRLYMPHEWARLLLAVGFDDVAFHGDVDGSALAPSSPRCVVVARKPTGLRPADAQRVETAP
jgi:SAM-dependent methyltransferase